MDFEEQLDAFLKSFCSLLYVGTPNHKLMKRKCIEKASSHAMDIWSYNISEGLRQQGKRKEGNRLIDPVEILDKILKINQEAFKGKRKMIFLEHFDLLLENHDPLVMTKLRHINDESTQQYTVILMGRPYFNLPEILADVPCINAPVMEPNDIQALLNDCDYGKSAHDKEQLEQAFKGLTALECENLASLSLAKYNRLDKDFIAKEKAFLMRQRSRRLIELCWPEGDLSQVGGLDVLKEWLFKRGKFIKSGESGRSSRLPFPRGVILTGPPGCGKSYIVSALAGSWGVNLVKLATSRLFSSLVGASEQNMLTALEIVKSLSPCILIIDEFEKFFPQGSSSQSDGGVLLRIVGIFLDFLQGDRDGVFICATSNSIIGLPQEMIRAGRFDSIFFIDLPNRREREAIFKVILRKYGLEDKIVISKSVLEATCDFSGAEIEQVVVETLYEYGDTEADINDFILIKTIKSIFPLARTAAEQIDSLRQWCFSRARFASYPEKQCNV